MRKGSGLATINFAPDVLVRVAFRHPLLLG